MRRQPDLLPSNRKRVPGEGVVADSPLGLRQGRWKRMNSSLKPGGMVPLSSCSTECLTPAAYPPSGREATSCRSAGSPKETRRTGDDTRLRSGQALKTPSGREYLVGGSPWATPSQQNGTYRPGIPLFDQ